MYTLTTPSCLTNKHLSEYLTLRDKIQAAPVLPSLEALADSDLIYNQQAAGYLKLEPKTLDIWRCTGRYNLPYVKIGRRVCYRAGDLKAFIASRMRIHTGDGGAA
jgi:hypothetical protein